MKNEEKETTLIKKINDFFNKGTESVAALASLIVAIISVLSSAIVTFSEKIKGDYGTNRMLFPLVIITSIIFLGLVSIQIYVIRRKRNEKIEKIKSNLIDKYTSALEQSFINPKMK